MRNIPRAFHELPLRVVGDHSPVESGRLDAEPDATIGDVIAAFLDLLWHVLTLGPRLIAMTTLALAETLRP